MNNAIKNTLKFLSILSKFIPFFFVSFILLLIVSFVSHTIDKMIDKPLIGDPNDSC